MAYKAPLAGKEPEAVKEWTVIAYIVADHEEAVTDDATVSIDEVAHLEVDNLIWAADLERINVAVQVDFTIQPGVLRVIANGEGTEKTMLPESGAGRVETFNLFVDEVAARCPAKHYMLLVWGHGVGPLGFFADSNADTASADADETLSLEELTAMLGHMREVTKRPTVDSLLIKSCCVASVEAVWQLRGVVDFLICSQARVPLRSWSYGEVFRALDGSPDVSAPKVLLSLERQFRRPIDRNQRAEVPFTLLAPAAIKGFDERLALLVRALLGTGADHPMILDALGKARPEQSGDAALLDVASMCKTLRALIVTAPALANAGMILDAVIGIEPFVQKRGALILDHRPVKSAFGGLGIFHFPPPKLRTDSFANEVTSFDYATIDLCRRTAWNQVAFAGDRSPVTSQLASL